MKKLLIITALLLFSTIALKAQILKPVSWSYAAKRVSATEAIVYIKAAIDEGWHLYSQNVKKGGPVKTSFTFQPSGSFTLEGKTIEPKPVTRFEDVFRMEVSYFEESVVFQQKIKIKQGMVGKPVIVKGTVEFMVCNDERCLPPDEVTLSIPVKK